MTFTPITVKKLLTDHLVNPLGIDTQKTTLGWQVESRNRNIRQGAYQLQTANYSAEFETCNLLWDTGKVYSDFSQGVRYNGAGLKSSQRVYWRVKVWDQDDQESEWSEPAFWEMGLLQASDWQADWIEPAWDEDPQAYNPSPFLRRAFHIPQLVKSARLYISAHGLYEAWLNGQRIGDQVFTPGFTAYDLRLQYQVYDVMDLLRPGENALGAILGDGWYRGEVYIASVRNVYGNRLGLLAMLKVELADGQEIIIGSDSQWKAATGPMLVSDMKAGETYDARLELSGWCSPGFDDQVWGGVRSASYPRNKLVASMGAPIRKKEVFHPREIIKTPKGETVIDFGQNLAGIARMKVIGERGTEIVLSHGETLDKDGNFTMENITKDQKPRFQEDHYILKGQGVEEFEPRFTVHGFRYVKVDGYPGQLSPEDFSAIAIYSDMESTGTFNCSNPQLNQLHQNVVWSMKGNFLDIPTDCPQRERAGWVGDAQIFAPSAAFLMDTRAFFGKWLKELSLEQYPDGMVGNFVPNPHKLVKSGTVALAKLIDGAAGWADAAVLVPWSQYQAFGDVQVLENQYASMKAWVDFVERKTHKTNVSTALNPRYWLDADFRRRVKLLWDTGYHWGEWLEPGQDLIRGGLFLGLLKRLLKNEIFGVSVVSTAYFANSTRILSQTATLLGKTKDAEKYRTLTEKVKAAYVETYIAEDGRIEPDRQSSYVRVLAFDLAPEKLKPAIVENLVRLIRAAGKHVGTGFLSTVFLCEVLAEYGHLELAYELLNQETNPSWLYAIKKGATTIWEKWDAVAEDGTATSSLNHYSPGAVVNYLHRKVAGIEAIEPGYKRFSIHPMPGGGLTSAKASYESVHGLISSEWEKENGVMRLNVTIPANTRAVITLPKAVLGQVTESGAPVSGADRITNAVQVDSNCQIELGSGNYYFEYPID